MDIHPRLEQPSKVKFNARVRSRVPFLYLKNKQPNLAALSGRLTSSSDLPFCDTSWIAHWAPPLAEAQCVNKNSVMSSKYYSAITPRKHIPEHIFPCGHATLQGTHFSRKENSLVATQAWVQAIKRRMIRMLLFLAAVVTVTAIFRDRNEDLARAFARRRRQNTGKRSVDAACALPISCM